MTQAIVLYGWHTLAHTRTQGSTEHTHTHQSKEAQHVYERTHSNGSMRRREDTRLHTERRYTHSWDSENRSAHTHRRNLRTQTLPLRHMQSEQRETLLPLSWWQWDQWLIDKRAAEKGNILLMSWRNPQSPLLPLILLFKRQQAHHCDPDAMMERQGCNADYLSKIHELFCFLTCFLTAKVWAFQPRASSFTLEWLLCKYGWLCQTVSHQQVTVFCYLCAVCVVQQEHRGTEVNDTEVLLSRPWTATVKVALSKALKPSLKSWRCNF